MYNLCSIKPTPFKTNIDYYRGKTKSIYEKEPIFRDFARNIPLSQSLDDSSSLHSLKRDFQKLVSARDPVLGRPDPLKPSAVGPKFRRQESVLFRINFVCSGSKPTLPAEERDALCSSQKSSTFSSYPPLHLRLPQVKLLDVNWFERHWPWQSWALRCCVILFVLLKCPYHD